MGGREHPHRWLAGEADARLTPKKEEGLAERGIGEKGEKRTLEVVVNKLHTWNNNNRTIANTCT